MRIAADQGIGTLKTGDVGCSTVSLVACQLLWAHRLVTNCGWLYSPCHSHETTMLEGFTLGLKLSSQGSIVSSGLPRSQPCTALQLLGSIDLCVMQAQFCAPSSADGAQTSEGTARLLSYNHFVCSAYTISVIYLTTEGIEASLVASVHVHVSESFEACNTCSLLTVWTTLA